MDELIAKISRAFERDLPGWDAHQKMINYDRPKPDNIKSIDPEARESAILALLYPKNEKIYTVLIERTKYPGVHSGQISFPGGKKEDQDKSLWHTALREAKEEIGIEPDSINLLGQLTEVYIPPSRFLVSPFLGYTKELPTFIREEKEVTEILEIPITSFMEPGRIKEKYHEIAQLDSKIKIKYFDIADKVIWGATAMMLSELFEIIGNNRSSESL